MAVVRPDDRAFFEACLALPGDELPRLVWADYLDETDRPRPAAFMRGGRGSALITAAAEHVQAGSDADRILRIVLWLAHGGQIASAADQVAAQGDAVWTMRAVLTLAERGQRQIGDSVAILKIGMHAAFDGAARAVKRVAKVFGHSGE
jgi:uncharacterized protein (TIGR02996 family)